MTGAYSEDAAPENFIGGLKGVIGYVPPKPDFLSLTVPDQDCHLCSGQGSVRDERGRLTLCQCYLRFVLARRMIHGGFIDIEHHQAVFNLEPDVEAHLITEKEKRPKKISDNPQVALRQLYKAMPIKINAFLKEFSDKLLAGMPKLKRPRNLFLFGPPGSGKTYAAAAIARRLFLHGFSPQFTTMENLVTTLIKAQRDPEAEILSKRYLVADLLVLDEIGHEYLPQDNDFKLSKITEFLRYRFRANLPIIATSNYLITELADKYMADNMSIFHEYIKIAMSKPEDHRKIRGRQLLDDFDVSKFALDDPSSTSR